MIELLSFLLRLCDPLFYRHGFKIVDSHTGPYRVAGASIILESKDMQLFLSIERDEMSLRMRSLYDDNKRNWFSFGLISALLGRVTATDLMDTDNSKFFEDNIDEIMERFSKTKAKETVIALKMLLARRLKQF